MTARDRIRCERCQILVEHDLHAVAIDMPDLEAAVSIPVRPLQAIEQLDLALHEERLLSLDQAQSARHNNDANDSCSLGSERRPTIFHFNRVFQGPTGETVDG